MGAVVLGLLNGISLGSILFLLASSLSLIMGVMGILNLAHGALYMVGAYVGWTIAMRYELNFGLAVLAGGVAAGLVGLVVERGFFRHLYRQLNEQVLLSFGLIYIVTNLCRLVWGPRSRAPFTASFLSGSFPIMGISYPFSRIMIIFIGLFVALGLWWLQDKTRVGAIVRAGMDDKEMVSGLGVNLERISVVVFFVGASIAGGTGVVGAELLGANLQLSIDVLLLALVVVIVGGVGSVQGALLGGMLIGCIDSLGKTLFPQAAMFTIYLAMIIILLARPTGLLGRKV
jgi:branched-chain amino acid transport system permease protein